MKHAETYPTSSTSEIKLPESRTGDLAENYAEDRLTPEQRHLIETVRRQCEEVTAADRAAIHLSSARDYTVWHDREFPPHAGLVNTDSTV